MPPQGTEGPRNEDPRHRGSQGVISDRTANIVIGVVTTIWAGNILIGMAEVNGYQPSSEINGIFMTIVGGALIARIKRGEPSE